MTDYDPRLVELYDDDNPAGDDHEFYRSLAAEASASAVLDLGCGTGLLTVAFTAPGRSVAGVDPSASMIDFARQRPGAGAVSWYLGDSTAIPDWSFDFAAMTGNVAQHIPDADWARSLRDIRAALRPGAILAFESRNPAARAWQSWSSPERTSRATAHGELVEWMDAEEVSPGIVELTAHNLFSATDDSITENVMLYFRDSPAISAELDAAGFTTEAIYGDWHRHPLAPTDPLVVFVARAR